MTFISVFCLLTAFTLFIVVYIKRKIQSENKYQFSELQKVFDKFVAENSHIRKEFRDKDDEMQKKLYEIKNKLTALKTFRDKEMVRVVNHFNVQLEVFENRFKILQEKLKSTIDIDVTAESYQQNPNEKMNHHQNRNTQKEEIISYNNAFNDWDAGNYGMDNLEDFYSKKKE